MAARASFAGLPPGKCLAALVLAERITAWGGTGFILGPEAALEEAFRAGPREGAAALLIACDPELEAVAAASCPDWPAASDEEAATHRRDDLAATACTVQWFARCAGRFGPGASWEGLRAPSPWEALVRAWLQDGDADAGIIAWLRRATAGASTARASKRTRPADEAAPAPAPGGGPGPEEAGQAGGTFVCAAPSGIDDRLASWQSPKRRRRPRAVSMSAVAGPGSSPAHPAMLGQALRRRKAMGSAAPAMPSPEQASATPAAGTPLTAPSAGGPTPSPAGDRIPRAAVRRLLLLPSPLDPGGPDAWA